MCIQSKLSAENIIGDICLLNRCVIHEACLVICLETAYRNFGVHVTWTARGAALEHEAPPTPHVARRAIGRAGAALLAGPRPGPRVDAHPLGALRRILHLSEKAVRLAQKMQVGPCVPVGIQR